MPNVEWDKYYLWSDGCAAQYKGRSSFFYLQNLPVRSERHFFGAEHGKNESDLETGVISKQLQVAIKSRSVVLKSAADMHSYLCDKNEDKDRVFKLVEQSHLNSIPKELKNPKLQTLSDKCTRLLHTIKPGANKGVFLTRNYSCFCEYCLKYEFKKCENKDFTEGKFEAHTLPIEETNAKNCLSNNNGDEESDVAISMIEGGGRPAGSKNKIKETGKSKEKTQVTKSKSKNKPKEAGKSRVKTPVTKSRGRPAGSKNKINETK